jgi:hypothetical protein
VLAVFTDQLVIAAEEHKQGEQGAAHQDSVFSAM